MALYALLGYTRPASAAGSGSADSAEPVSADSVDRLTAELVASEELVYAVGLADAAFAQVVTVRDGEATVADASHRQERDELSSLIFVDVTSHDRALQVAARTAALLGPIELRPVDGGAGSSGDAGGDGL